MQAKLPDTYMRHIAVVLGTGGSGQPLLNVLQPLLSKDTEINLQGVFVEDDELQRAASLPFVKEVCRLTLSVREIHGERFERTAALRTRTARREIEKLAQLTGVHYSFRNVRGSKINWLQQAAHSSDITVFEPLQIFTAPPKSPASRPQRRIVVAIDDLATAVEALTTARLISKGALRQVSILMKARDPAERNALGRLINELFPTELARLVPLRDSGAQQLIHTARAERADMLVIGASEELLKPESLRLFLDQLRCPICLVRGGKSFPMTNGKVTD